MILYPSVRYERCCPPRVYISSGNQTWQRKIHHGCLWCFPVKHHVKDGICQLAKAKASPLAKQASIIAAKGMVCGWDPVVTMAFNAVKNWIIWGTPILGHPIYVLLTCACLLVSAIVYRFVACLMFDVWRSYARTCPFHKHGHSAQNLQ